MKLKYMVERLSVIENGQVVGYKPIGVWVVGPTLNNFTVAYLPEVDLTDLDDMSGFWIQNRRIEDDAGDIPEDFLEYHIATESPYHGARGPIIETDEYDDPDLLAEAILAKLQQTAAAE